MKFGYNNFTETDLLINKEAVHVIYTVFLFLFLF